MVSTTFSSSCSPVYVHAHAIPTLFLALPSCDTPSLDTCREVGTIIRSLGCCPSEAELHDMLQEVEEEEPTGFIRYEKFQPMMARVLVERR